jgi:ribosomal protein L7/L12
MSVTMYVTIGVCLFSFILLAAGVALIVRNQNRELDDFPTGNVAQPAASFSPSSTVQDAPAAPPPPPAQPPPPVDRPAPALEEQVRRLVDQGRKIEAIKLYREVTGTGLKEAKEAVEMLERGGPMLVLPPTPLPPDNWQAQVAEQLRLGRKIEAIKLYREATGVGLKEAKEAVEAMEAGTMPPPTPAAAPPSGDWRAEVVDFLRRGQKIWAVKRYREATGVGLKEAKDAVDEIERTL